MISKQPSENEYHRLLDLAYSRDWTIRRSVFDHYEPSSVKFFDAIARALCFDPSEAVRSRAIEFLGGIGKRGNLRTLFACLKTDEAWIVRASAASSLAQFPSEAVRKELISALMREEDAGVVGYLAVALADVGRVGSLPTIVELLNREQRPAARVGLLYARYILDEQGRLEPLLEMFSEDDYHIRCQVLDVLRRSKPKDTEAIRDFLLQSRGKEMSVAVASTMDAFLAEL